ncbi:hypothetical protein G9A89_011979 [Geosiphon pyriformis]|nr:hypothetical protein G9A89_011979 [Geosiphon pyriformis]
MKKIAEKFGSGDGFKFVLSRKKRKGVALDKGVDGKRVLAKVSGGHSWSSETGDITESESINMEKECLVEETSFDYGENGAIADEKHDQTPKEPGTITKTALGKPLKKINFSNLDVDDNVLLDAFLKLPSSLKNLVLVSVRKSFALDIGLDKVVEKSFQEKLMVVRRLFSRVNGFGRASVPSKFSEIIHASFTSEASLVQATEKTRAVDILVRCAVVCFDSAESLNAVIKTTLVLRGSNLRWSSFVSTRCAKCEKLDHTSLSCAKSKKVSSSGSFCKVLSNSDKSRLAAIYAKHSAPVPRSVSFGGLSCAKVTKNVGSSSKIKLFLTAAVEINDRFAALEHSLASLTENVNMLAKRLATLVSMVSQLGPRCQPLVTPSSQNQGADIVMSKGLNVATSGETIVEAVIFDNFVIGKIENTLRNLAIMDKFEEVRIFTSGLKKGYVGVGMAIVMCGSLAYHVSKVEEVPGRIVSVHLLFKNKLSVMFLGLYAGVSTKMRFAQASGINLLIFKTVNMSSFMVLCGDFNEDRTKNENLVLTVVGQEAASVSGFFDTNHNMVGVSLGLGGLNVDTAKWMCFKKLSLAALVLKNAVCGLANEVFSKHWFCKFDGPRNKQSSRFFRLESLVAKVLKCLCSGHMSKFDCLVQVWVILDNVEAFKFTSKYYEAKLAKSECIKDVIDKHMKNFNLNKSGIIRSILERPFHKIVLDYLVIGDELILKPEECCLVLPGIWAHQYALLAHVGNDVFLEVMCEISLDKLSLMVSKLSNGKATGLSGISNELWKHSDNGVMVCLLDLLNFCLKIGDVPVSWKRAWVSMIPKLYD